MYMPFNFEWLSDDKAVISNLTGEFSVLEKHDLLEVANSEISERNKINSTSTFLYENESEKNSLSKLHSSSYARRTLNSLKSPFLFIIVPTLRCDHDCTYCQVSRANLDAAGVDLDIGSIEPIVNLIERVGKPPYKIEFQGGEPLLRFDFIKHFINRFDQDHGEESEYIIATSLSLLNNEIIEFSKNNNVHFSVSLDGTSVFHDSQRRNVIASSHQMAGNGILALSESIGIDRVATVTTITRDALRVPQDIIDGHNNLGLKNMFVRPLSPYGFASYKMDKYYSTNEYLAYYSKLLDLLVAQYDDVGIVEHMALIHLQKIFRPDKTGYNDLKSPAGYLLGSLIINYDGNIFGADEARMIYEQHKTKELVVGHIGNPDFKQHDAGIEILSNSFISEMPMCNECAYQPYCGADPLHHLSLQQDLIGDKSTSFFCQIQKGIFGKIFKMIDDKKSMKVFDQWLAYGSR